MLSHSAANRAEHPHTVKNSPTAAKKAKMHRDAAALVFIPANDINEPNISVGENSIHITHGKNITAAAA